MATKNLHVGINIVILVKYWCVCVCVCVGGYLKIREYLCMQAIIWVNTIQNHIDIWLILPRYVGSCMTFIPQ
jgi:hypothetical protein